MIRLRKCLGIMELKTGVTIITIFAILNKVSGFFGIFASGGVAKILMYLYSVFAVFAFSWGLYGVLIDNTRIVGRYAIAYVVDLIINAIQTIALAVTWFISRNHLLGEPQPDQGGDSTPISDEVRQGFEFEGGISILILLSLWCLHLYFALVVWSYSYSLIHRYDLPTNMVGGAMNSGSDSTPMMFLPRVGQDRGKHTVLRNEDDDDFI
ncbi:inositol phosphorylceramide synthase regulatory subunit [Entomortierella parvispora]|uniref:Inositol phosphorylceramide synthase regulatory subunit n=1 Tax=Entomortierella parvispora TaxID=205924 RepID=A0A9P3HFX9_9FUNG|nr:inositol phosphorylceramide synthase regulatory subunit [Entomortierella parvispora]